MSFRRHAGDLVAETIAALAPPRLMASRRFFGLWEARGYHVTPVHFYQPIPDSRELPETLWTQASDLPGVDMREAEQLELMRSLASSHAAECGVWTEEPSAETYFLNNGYFDAVDAEVLYCLVRTSRPRRVLEIGSGFSTRVISEALERNGSGELISIEPFPTDRIPRSVRRRQQRVQEVPVEEFADLVEGDILFIDSSHVLAVGSDVCFEYLEVLPRVQPGVLIHVHDVFFPFDYPREWVLELRRFWNEQYLVQAFLAFNSEFEVVWSSAYMAHHHPMEVSRAFPAFESSRGRPASLWFRRRHRILEVGR